MHVMSDLVGDHVGLREVAGGLVFGLQLVKKAKVEIDFFVRGAVKRPGLRARHAARARDRVSKKYQTRVLILRAARLKHSVPRVLGLRRHS